MNWESSVLNRIYRTLEFKISPPSYNKLSTKAKQVLIPKIKEHIDYYGLANNKKSLFGMNIGVNENCALYNLNEDNSTYYFNIYTNWYFYIYVQIFELGAKYIEEDKDLVYKWENYFLHLLFLKEVNETMFNKEIKTNLNKHFQYKNFILNNFSYFDIVLFSIMFNTSIYHQSDLNEDILYFKRWQKYSHDYLVIDDTKLINYLKFKEKENLNESYKLTSSQKLVQAVTKKDYALMRKLLGTDHENVNSRRPKDYKTLSHIACLNADYEAIKILQEFKCDLESYDFENMTPLYDAIYSCNIQFVEYLITALHLDLHHKEIQNRTPFYWAACIGDIPMIQYLLTKSVDINSTSSMGRTPLSKACWNGRTDIVKILCQQKGIILDCPDKNGRFPLHNAVWGEYGGRQGKKMNGGISADCPQAAQYLIDYGANIEVTDNEGDTPFMIAASTNGIESMKVLVKAGAQVNRVNNRGESALIQATQYGNWESVGTMLNFIVDNKALIDLEIKDKGGYRAIEHAIVYKRVICLKMLFEYDDRYNNENDIINLAITCIKGRSYLCFEYLMNKLKTINTVTNYEGIKEMMMRIVCLKEIRFFNCLYKYMPKVIDEIFNKDDMICLVYTNELISVIGEKEDDNKEENEMIFADKENIYNQILKIKMSELNQEQISLIDNDYEAEEEEVSYSQYSLYCSNIKTLIDKITKNYFNENKIANDTLLKVIINYSDKDAFDVFIKSFPKENSFTFSNINTQIPIVKEYFDKFKTSKHSFESINTLNNSLLAESITDFNSNTLLSLSITNEHNVYFNELIQYPIIKKEILSTLPISNKNILHILFEDENYKEKFNSIISIIQTELQSSIESFLHKLNESDIYSFTPLDILLRNENSDLIEDYTKILNDLEQKYIGETHSSFKQNITHYTVKNFTIQSEEKLTEPSIKEYIVSKLKECQSINNSKQIIPLDTIYDVTQYKITSQTKQFIFHISELVSNNSIEKEFLLSNKEYKHLFIDDESTLKRICEEDLSKQEVIGVDAEFDGSSYEKDGIVCLIQISSMNCSYAIDCLKLRSEITKHLKGIFENEKIIKVFHGCDNDLFWILGNFDIFTKNIYDTARAFIVYQNVILNKTFKIDNLPSLYYLVKFFFNVKLDKSYQKSNWKIRPLTRNMMQYAFNDAKSVLYLYYIFQGLFMYITQKKEFENKKEIGDLFDSIQAKFFDNRENIDTMCKDIPYEKGAKILSNITYKCLVFIKEKIKSSYIKLTITLS